MFITHLNTRLHATLVLVKSYHPQHFRFWRQKPQVLHRYYVIPCNTCQGNQRNRLIRMSIKCRLHTYPLRSRVENPWFRTKFSWKCSKNEAWGHSQESLILVRVFETKSRDLLFWWTCAFHKWACPSQLTFLCYEHDTCLTVRSHVALSRVFVENDIHVNPKFMYPKFLVFVWISFLHVWYFLLSHVCISVCVLHFCVSYE